MRKIYSAGLLIGISVALGGGLLFAYELLHNSSTPVRVWNLLRWLGLGLPTPADPRLIELTLAFLNVPLWGAVSALGFCIAAAFVLMRVVDR